MTYLVERLAELRRHLQHLEEIAPRVTDRAALERDLSLHNDVLFSLLMVAQLVIDIAGELSARRGDRFEDYTEAVRNLARDARSLRHWSANSNTSRVSTTSSFTNTSHWTSSGWSTRSRRLAPIEEFAGSSQRSKAPGESARYACVASAENGGRFPSRRSATGQNAQCGCRV